MRTSSTRAKWRALRSARSSTLKKHLTPPTLSERRCEANYLQRGWGTVGTPIVVQQKLMRHTSITIALNIYDDVVTDEMTPTMNVDIVNSSAIPSFPFSELALVLANTLCSPGARAGSSAFQTTSCPATYSNLRCLSGQAIRQDKLLVADSFCASV